MKAFKVLFLALFVMLFAASSVMAAGGCTTIQSGLIVNSANVVITPGFNDEGYNYEAHLFNGPYDSSMDLVMKWNDAWLSNKDCDLDGFLDRHFGYDSYIGSGAWETNHQSGKVEVNGKMRQWTYFCKIVAVDVGDDLIDGIWYRGNTIVGPDIWGQFAIVEEVYNDPSANAHGILYKSPLNPGVGNLN